jgi:hypothetical protein
VPAWIPLGLVLVGVLALVAKLGREAQARGVARIDLTRYRLHADGRWVSPAWTARLERLLVRGRTLAADDRGGIEELVREVAALSFVREVGSPKVEWPDGLVLPVRLYQPVACLRVGNDFLPVAADGTLLAGYGYAPHGAFGGHLPVLGPHGLDARPDDPFQPGDVLGHPAHLAALAVASSMWEYLDQRAVRQLGRVVIDASRSHAWDGKPGGVLIDLEGARRVHFGRPPVRSLDRSLDQASDEDQPEVQPEDQPRDQPGELPVATKWAHVREALDRWAAGEDFAAVDVRWDEPDWLSPAGEDR